MADPGLGDSLLAGNNSNSAGESLLAGNSPSSTASDPALNTGASGDIRIDSADLPRPPSILGQLKTKFGHVLITIRNFESLPQPRWSRPFSLVWGWFCTKVTSIGGYLRACISFTASANNSGGATQDYASVEQKTNLENAQGERTKIYKDYIEYSASYLTAITFFVGCITTFGGLLTFVSYFGGMKSKKYFIINLVSLLGTFLFGFAGAALITYSHIRKLKWAKIYLHRRISNLRNRVNFAPSTDALLMDEYEVQISELKASLGDERDFGVVAFIFFSIAGFCMIIWLVCWGIYDIPGHLKAACEPW